MSKVKIQGNPNGTGALTIAAPNTNTDRTLTLPDQTGTLLTGSGPISVNASAPTGAVTVDASGNLLAGTASVPSGAGSGSGWITATGGFNGTLRSRTGTNTYSGNGFSFYWNGSAQLWVDNTNIGNITVSSDYRIKRNVETQTRPALARVMELRPVTYQMADYGGLFKASDDIKEGFIAHELQEVIPSAVNGKKDDPEQIQSLKLDALVSVLTKAIQEQQAIIEDLKTRIAALEAPSNGGATA